MKERKLEKVVKGASLFVLAVGYIIATSLIIIPFIIAYLLNDSELSTLIQIGLGVMCACTAFVGILTFTFLPKREVYWVEIK